MAKEQGQAKPNGEGTALQKVDRIRKAANLPLEQWSDERIQTIVAMVAPGASTIHEVAIFLSICDRYQLDPTLGEVWLSQIRGRPVVLTGRDSYIKIAQRDEGYAGFDADVVREKDEFSVERIGDQVTVHHKKTGFNRGKLLGAYAVVYHDSRHPVYVEKHWDELKHLHTKDVWKENPTEMLLTRALTFALKLQFNLGGLFTQADVVDGVVDGEDVADDADRQDLAARTQNQMAALKEEMGVGKPPEGEDVPHKDVTEAKPPEGTVEREPGDETEQEELIREEDKALAAKEEAASKKK